MGLSIAKYVDNLGSTGGAEGAGASLATGHGHGAGAEVPVGERSHWFASEAEAQQWIDSDAAQLHDYAISEGSQSGAPWHVIIVKGGVMSVPTDFRIEAGQAILKTGFDEIPIPLEELISNRIVDLDFADLAERTRQADHYLALRSSRFLQEDQFVFTNFIDVGLPNVSERIRVDRDAPAKAAMKRDVLLYTNVQDTPGRDYELVSGALLQHPERTGLQTFQALQLPKNMFAWGNLWKDAFDWDICVILNLAGENDAARTPGCFAHDQSPTRSGPGAKYFDADALAQLAAGDAAQQQKYLQLTSSNYWPEEVDKPYVTVDGITITRLAKEDPRVARTIEEVEGMLTGLEVIAVALSQGEEDDKICYIPRYVHWADHGVLDDDSQLEILRRVTQRLQAEAAAASRGPIDVNCRGGIGRTGTFIAYCLISEYIESLPAADRPWRFDKEAIDRMLVNFRRQRGCSDFVQTAVQLNQLYRAIAARPDVIVPEEMQSYAPERVLEVAATL